MIKQKEFTKRRHDLMDLAGEGSVIIARAATQKLREPDARTVTRPASMS